MQKAHPTLRGKDVARIPWRSANALWDGTVTRFTYNARGALYQLMGALPAGKGREVLVPAFHCPTVVEAILRAGYQPVFYKVTRLLSIDYNDVREKISRDVVAIVVINYCGFPADIGAILELRDKYGCVVIDDWAHSFLNAQTGKLTGEKGDAAVFSFYKLVPTAVGGGLRVNNPELLPRPSAGGVGFTHSLILLKRLLEQAIDNSEAGLIKTGFQFLENKRVARKRRRDTPGVRVSDTYAFDVKLASTRMPWFSKRLLTSSDFTNIIAARRDHYKLLTENLKEHAGIRLVFPRLPDEVCPWACPVIVHGRGNFDRALRAMGVPLFTFGETLHPLVYTCDRRTADDAVYLSHNLLMLAIHQNLLPETVLTAARTINNFLKKAA